MDMPTTTTHPTTARTGPLQEDGLHVIKAHGTGNDFLVLLDPQGTMPLTAELVRRLCDRHRGLGADGVIRAVARPGGSWFMDHWNQDGAPALMCGNGVRVMLHALVVSQLVDRRTSRVEVLSRSGSHSVTLPQGDHPHYRVAMGEVVVSPTTIPVTLITAEGILTASGTQVQVGNPHVVVELPMNIDLEGVVLEEEPRLSSQGTNDVNLELISHLQATGQRGASLQMRIHERGVGETLSCGTGAVAAAAVAFLHTRRDHWSVEVPGGVLDVGLDVDGEGKILQSHLSGPVEIVARATLTHAWLR